MCCSANVITLPNILIVRRLQVNTGDFVPPSAGIIVIFLPCGSLHYRSQFSVILHERLKNEESSILFDLVPSRRLISDLLFKYWNRVRIKIHHWNETRSFLLRRINLDSFYFYFRQFRFFSLFHRYLVQNCFESFLKIRLIV